jgi:hypothetical protein
MGGAVKGKKGSSNVFGEPLLFRFEQFLRFGALS